MAACRNFTTQDAPFLKAIGNGDMRAGREAARSILEQIELGITNITYLNEKGKSIVLRGLSNSVKNAKTSEEKSAAFEAFVRSFDDMISTSEEKAGAIRLIELEELLPEKMEMSTELERIVHDMEIRVRKVESILNTKKEKSKSNKAVEKILDGLAHNEKLVAIAKFIAFSSGYTSSMSHVMEEIKEGVRRGNTEEMLDKVRAVRRYLKATSDINAFATLGGNNSAIYSMLQQLPQVKSMLAYVIKKRNAIDVDLRGIQNDYLLNTLTKHSTRTRTKYANELRKTWDERNNPENNKLTEQQTANKESFVEAELATMEDKIHKEEKAYIESQLLRKRGDIDWFSTLFVGPQHLNDTMITLANKVLDRADFETKRATRERMNEGKEVVDKFFEHTKAAKSEDERYAFMIEDAIKIDKDGNAVFDSKGNPVVEKGKKADWKVQKYYGQIYDIENNYIRAIREAEAEGDTAKVKKITDEYNDWHSKNFIYDSHTESYVPSKHWVNPQYEKIQKSAKPLKDMYDFIMETDNLADSYLDVSFLKLDGRMVKRRVDAFENMDRTSVVEGLKEGAGDIFSVREDETEFGLIGHSKQDAIPVHYRRKIEDGKISHDLLTSSILNYKQSLNYANKSDVQLDVEFMRDAVGNRKIYTETVEEVYNPQKHLGYDVVERDGTKYAVIPKELKEGKDSNAYRAIKAVVEARLYGKEWQSDPKTVKAVQSVMGYVGKLLMTFSFPQAVKNLAQGMLMNIVMASGHGLYTSKNLAKAMAMYAGRNPNTDKSGMLDMLSDIGKTVPTSFINLLSDRVDARFAWEAFDTKFSNKGKARRFFSGKTLNMGNNMGEHMIQNVLMLAVMDATMVDGPKGKVPMHQAYEVRDGKLVLKDGFNVTREQEFDVSMKIRDAATYMFGNYANEWKALAQRNAAGAAVTMFRKWMPSGIKSRWRGLQWGDVSPIQAKRMEDYNDGFYNENSRQFEQGAYVTTLRFVKGYMHDFFVGKREIDSMPLSEWNRLSTNQKADIVRTMKETVVMMSLFVAAMIAGGKMKDTDDPDERRRLAWLAYFSKALQQEFTFYINPNDTIKMLKNPTALLSATDNIQAVAGSLYDFIFADESKEDKAREKFGRSFFKAIPGVRATQFDPEITYQWISR